LHLDSALTYRTSSSAMSLKGVYSTGYAVLGATAISSVVAAFFL
jgi:hypothetical protein